MFEKIKSFFGKIFGFGNKEVETKVWDASEDVNKNIEPEESLEVEAPNTAKQTLDSFASAQVDKLMANRGYTIENLHERALKNITNEEIRLVVEKEAIKAQIAELEQKRDKAIELSKDNDMHRTANVIVAEYREILKPYYEKIEEIESQIEYNASLRDIPVDEFEVCIRAGIQHNLLNRLRKKFIETSKKINIPQFAKRKYDAAKGKVESLQTKEYTREELAGIFLQGKQSKFEPADIKANIVSVLDKNGNIKFEGEKAEELKALYEKLKKAFTKSLKKAVAALKRIEAMCETKSNIEIYKEIAKIEEIDYTDIAEQATEELVTRYIAGCKSDINMLNQVVTVTYEEMEAALINRISAKYLKEAAKGVGAYNSDYKEYKNEHKGGCSLANFAKVSVRKVDPLMNEFIQISDTTVEQ